MEFLSIDFLYALLTIVVIDLVLAGDNAIVIGLSARHLPKDQQKKAIFWGTFGAIAIRAVATVFVVWLLKIPGLLLVGGLLLIWIAYKLLVEEKKHDIKPSDSLWHAIRTILIADAVMGLDNVLAIAGAAHGSFLLVILGLLISVPVVVWGSTYILKWIERFPALIYIGSGVLAFTAAKMIIGEPFVAPFFEGNPVLRWGVTVAVVAAVLLLGRAKNQRQKQQLAS